jgi:chemotaxis protein methyltransferase CheR
MSPQVFLILSSIVRERSGLHFDASHASIFAEKTATRAEDAGFESLLDYYYFLRYDPAGPAETERLVEALVVNETYLFRELPQLAVAVAGVPAILATGRRPRIWCAACATGEEPLTLAMLLADGGWLDEVDLVASDISASVLARAREGRLGRRALRGEIPAFAERWLRVGERNVTVDPRLRDAIDWRRVNLIDDAAFATLGLFDLIFCRNVLIYFSDETARQVVDSLTGTLRPGGTLFVGISESLLRLGTALRCEEENGVFCYRKVP